MKLLPLAVFFFAVSAHAERLTTRVHSIDYASKPGQPHLIQFENGRVGFLSPAEKASTLTLEDVRRRGEWIDVELDGKGNYMGAGVIPTPKEFSADPEPTTEPVSYEPTNLGTLSEASVIFKRMNKRHQWNSQCYNRAHVWAYEEFRRTGLKSMKLFMFFTRSYIRKYRYKWWFHVTPMTYVSGAPMTLDRTFMGGPAAVKTWTDKFIYSKRNCPVVYKYSQYRNNQETEHCYLHPATMYYWQPRDLENNERTGFEKTQFIKKEVDWAYYEAF